MKKPVLTPALIRLNANPHTKQQAIQMAAAMLIEQGYVAPNYMEAMLLREQTLSTYIGNGVAVPHGVDERGTLIHHAGIAILQMPQGVHYGEQLVTLLIAVAGNDATHLALLSRIATVCMEEENVARLVAATSKDELMSAFSLPASSNDLL